MKHLFICLILAISNILVIGQTPISEVQGQQDTSPLDGQSVTITGIVTGVSAGNGFFVQDGQGAWSGIYVYDPSRNPMPVIGDSVLLIGSVTEYYNLTEIKTLTSFQILASGKEIPAPVELKSGEIAEPYEGVLVKINNVVCTNPNLGYGEWQADDGSGPVVINDFIFKYTPEEGISYSVTGVLDFSFDFYKIEPRNADDVIINAPLYFVEGPQQINISGNSVTLKWKTNELSTTELVYGKTIDIEVGPIVIKDSVTEHEITINDLEPGEIYYVKAYSVMGNDTTPSDIKSYTTMSNSSGEMHFYFGYGSFTMLTSSGGTGADEFYLSSFTDTIAAYIQRAQNTLDIAIYDVVNHCPCSDKQNTRIFDAITERAKAGVKVRIITDDTSSDPFFTEIMNYAQVMWGNQNGIMHNKFIVADRESEQSSWVVTGSVNWTYNNLVMDANNLVCIQDKSLAKAYTAEFDEMWGGSSDTPNYDKSFFGLRKKQNTPQKFIIDGTPVELYFSPSDNTEKHIIEALKTANHEVSLAMMAFTSDGLGQAIRQISKDGIEVFGTIDYVEYDSTEYELMRKEGADIEGFSNPNGLSWPTDPTIHHKFAVVDYYHEDSDPMVITGTHNWTASAETKNDENTLIIHDEAVARIFNNEIIRLRGLSSSSSKAINEKRFNVYPNPFEFGIHLKDFSSYSEITIRDFNGRSLFKSGKHGTQYFDLSFLKPGIYFLEILSNDNLRKANIQKIVKL